MIKRGFQLPNLPKFPIIWVLLFVTVLVQLTIGTYVDAATSVSSKGKNAGGRKSNSRVNFRPSIDCFSGIVKGQEAKRGEFPYQVAILGSGNFFCGGTLLSSQHVLTAAHCYGAVEEYGLDKITVLVRSTKLNPPDSNSIQRNVKNFTSHPEYFGGASNKNDIAVITLAEPITEKIRKVQLEPLSSPKTKAYVGKDAVIIGWGRMTRVLFPGNKSFGKLSNSLMKAKMNILDTLDCGILYHDADPLEYSLSLYSHPEKFVCIASFTEKNACQGDSGGPVFVGGKQVGVTSFSIGCSDPRYPGVYTRVRPYRSWINSVMKSSSSNSVTG